MRSRLLGAAALCTLLSPAAYAAPCAGFTDVDDANPAQAPFCASVEWIRNRQVTTGCGGTLYCPTDPVSRLQMAAFMTRLGTALTPVQLRVDVAPGAVDLDAATSVVCQSGGFAVVNYPRTAYLDLAFTATASSDVNFAADLVKSTNGGASWQLVTTQTNRGSVPSNGWASLANLATTDLSVGETVIFGVRLSRDGMAGTADLTDSRCQLRALIHSRTGATSPL
jgi:hypothetical protein